MLCTRVSTGVRPGPNPNSSTSTITSSSDACARTRMPKTVNSGTDPVNSHVSGLVAPRLWSR
jgi:hypothetical protein